MAYLKEANEYIREAEIKDQAERDISAAFEQCEEDPIIKGGSKSKHRFWIIWNPTEISEPNDFITLADSIAVMNIGKGSTIPAQEEAVSIYPESASADAYMDAVNRWIEILKQR